MLNPREQLRHRRVRREGRVFPGSIHGENGNRLGNPRRHAKSG